MKIIITILKFSHTHIIIYDALAHIYHYNMHFYNAGLVVNETMRYIYNALSSIPTKSTNKYTLL